MKELEDIWNKPGNGRDDDLSSMLDMDTINGYRKHDPIRKLRNKLVVNMTFGLATAIVYAYLVKMNPAWPLILAFGMVILITVVGVWHTYQLHQKLGRQSMDGPLLPTLIEKRNLTREWIRQQQQATIFFYPICAVSGFMLGGSIGAGKPVTEVMSDHRMIIIMVVVAALITFPAMLLGKWLTKKAFGKQLLELEQNIETLSHE
jgi:hypothetical protein